MSAPGELESAGRGAQRRRSLRERKREAEVLSWWTRPGVLVFLGAFGLAAGGWGLLVHAARRLPVAEATLDGLNLHVDDARWVLDQMDHGENFKMPAAMMPDLPSPGSQRITMTLAFQNRAREGRDFRGEEFALVPEIGEEVPPFGAVVGEAHLEPGQTLNTALHFDLDTRKPHGRLLMAWRRNGKVAYFSVPEPAAHYHLRPRGGDDLPPDARLLLPIGKAARGERLYAGVYGCSGCHGDPKVPGSNNVGPDLARIGVTARDRVAGLPAAQYIYQSILDPGAYIAPECKGGQPCEQPSAMPEYASLLTLQDAADLLSYLLEQQGG